MKLRKANRKTIDELFDITFCECCPPPPDSDFRQTGTISGVYRVLARGCDPNVTLPATGSEEAMTPLHLATRLKYIVRFTQQISLLMLSQSWSCCC
jgi:hypothetical protein